MTSEPSGPLEEQVRALTLRVWQMERALAAHGIVVAAEAPSAAPKAPVEAHVVPRVERIEPPGVDEAVRAPRPAVRSFAVADPNSREDARSLESRIGSLWFNRLGILAVLIAVAWFLKLAFDNHWIGPLGRVLIGLAGGAALIAWSERFQRRGFRAFAYSLKAIGSGTLYLSLWAAFSIYALISAPVAFAAMIVVTAFNGFMSWVQDAELLALYAIAGGLGTPLLVSTGGNHEVTLFTYLLMLDVAVLVLVALRPWSRLLFAAFAGTCLFVFAWWMEFYSYEQAGRTALFLLCFFLIFALAPRLVRLRAEATPAAWDQLAVTILPMATAALGFVGFYFLLEPGTAEWAGPWLAVAFAAFYLLMLRLPARGALHTANPLLSALHLATAVVFLTIAIPLKTHGRWLTIGWLVEGVALLWLANRIRSVLLRVLALICLCLGMVALVTGSPDASITPILNQRFGTYLVAIVVFALVARIASQGNDEHEPATALQWPTVAAESVLIVNALILLAVGWEIHSFWWYLNWRGDFTLMHDYRMYAQFTYSAFFMLFGAVLLGIGFWRRSAFLRWQALVLLAISVAKVFVFDVGQLSRGFRILSFLGLGALLLGVSFVYQRDWLNLRGSNEAQGSQS